VRVGGKGLQRRALGGGAGVCGEGGGGGRNGVERGGVQWRALVCGARGGGGGGGGGGVGGEEGVAVVGLGMWGRGWG